jgi:hypothetical protein
MLRRLLDRLPDRGEDLPHLPAVGYLDLAEHGVMIELFSRGRVFVGFGLLPDLRNSVDGVQDELVRLVRQGAVRQRAGLLAAAPGRSEGGQDHDQSGEGAGQE